MTTRSRRAWALRLFALVLPMLLAACRPRDQDSSYAPEPDYAYDEDYGDYGDYGGYGGEAETIADYERMEEAAPSAKQRFKAKKETMAPGRSMGASGGAAAPEGDVAPAPEPMDVPELDVPEPEQPASAASKRQIIYTATLQVSVYDLDAALATVEALPGRFGGWMQQRVDNQIVLRIPADKLDAAIALVSELGVVDYRLLEALDVTAEYTDLESRLRVLSEIQAQLRALLAEAKTVEQALEIRRALDAVTLELELARAQMRELAKSIAFSTLILRLVERGPGVELPSSNDPFPWVDELGVEATDYR